MAPPPEWSRIEAALDELLEVPAAERTGALARIAQGDATLRLELEALLAEVDRADGRLDAPALAMLGDGPAEAAPATGGQAGPYRLTALIGRGGMGEVYRAERADGQFEQTVAVKLIRPELAEAPARFQAERRILARLEHPGIARLIDGGVAGDGRLYMVMELVPGVPITDWCQARSSDLATRLHLFMAACDAVAYAHRNLVIHRDIKPSNVLVTGDGTLKLLDFGVAKLLSAPGDAETQTAAFTPGYAAPEQLTLGAITTATDVYALGVLLSELLTGQRLWKQRDLPLSTLLAKVLDEPAPLPSRVAAESPSPPVPARLIQGDLDAIVAKALRKEPEHRYATVDALREDVARTLRGEPVAARSGARLYVLGRTLRRYRALVAGVALVGLAIAGGGLGMAWQARRAEREAARATAINDFLLSVFKASDPRIASDKPRGQITARELLDAGAGQIERDFAGQPETEIALLGTVGSIYHMLDERERATALHKRQLELARAHYGDESGVVTDILVDQADELVSWGDYGAALPLLDETDMRLRREGRDDTPERALWWLTRGRCLIDDPARQPAREAALKTAVALYGRLAPTDFGYVSALNELANINQIRLDLRTAVQYYRQAIAVPQAGLDRDDAALQTIYGNMALALTLLGDWPGAEQAYDQAAAIAERTSGRTSAEYWIPASQHARMVHTVGDRERALRMFEALEPYLPTAATTDRLALHDKAEEQEYYAERLSAEGRPQLAIPLLEASERQYHDTPEHEFELRRVHQVLGDAYDRAGRTEDAGRLLRSAFDERTAKDPPDHQAVLGIRERWGRFLLDRGDLDGAEAQFRMVLEADHGRGTAQAALARGGLARLALARGDRTGAVAAADAAAAAFDHVSGMRDVRWGPYLWRIQARALLAAGDPAGAHRHAQQALEASTRYDAPESAAIAEARALIAAAGG